MVASAQDVGLDACLLDSMTAAIRRGEDYSNVHAVLIVKDDRLVYEQYFSGTDRRWRGDGLGAVSVFLLDEIEEAVEDELMIHRYEEKMLDNEIAHLSHLYF